MRVYECDDYKAYLANKIEENKMVKGYRGFLAEAANCKKSFISQVLNSHVHFTPDHAASLAEFWRLTAAETTFFIDLVLYARAGAPALKKVIHERLQLTKTEQTELSTRLRWESISDTEIQQTFFSSWYWSAIHVIVAIQKYSSAQAIAARLGLPISLVEDAIEKLSQWKLIEKTKLGWKVTENKIHLPRASAMNEMNHLNWRHRALTSLQKQESSALHYSMVFALSLEDFEKLKELLLQFLEGAHGLIGPSPSEEIMGFTCDLFRV